MSYPIRLLQTAHVGLIDPDGKMLLVQGYYGKNKEKPSQRWMLPGGHREQEDASLVDTCYRELGEELGLTSANFGELHPVDCFDWGHPKRAETIFLGRLLSRPRLRIQENEIHKAQWFTQEQAMAETFINNRFKAAVEKAFHQHAALQMSESFHMPSASNF